MRHWKLVVMGLAVSGQTACGRTMLFHDNFDTDPVGSPPVLFPPGDPVDDRIEIVAKWAQAESPATVIEENALQGRSLRYSNIAIPTLYREVRFHSADITPARPEYWATWAGRLDDFAGSSATLNILVGNFGIGSAIFQIDSDARVWVRTPTGEYAPVGNLTPGVEHILVVHIDNTTGKYTLQALGPTLDLVLDVAPQPLLDRGLWSGDPELVIQVRFEGTSASSASYVMDGILIEEQRPRVAP